MLHTTCDRFVQFVLKSSKLCNLRCRYCYEFAELAQRDQMPLAQLRGLYERVSAYYDARDAQDGQRTEVHFIWHGGEPLLTKPAYYWETFADQQAIFGGRVLKNSVQTNLTVLDDARVILLRDGFQSVGVSLDLYGELRVDLAGRASDRRVLANLDRLTAAGVSFGAITVLTRANLHHLDAIFRFYEATRIPFRILPLFDTLREGQHAGYELSTDDIAQAWCRLIDLWLASPSPPAATPTLSHLKTALRGLQAGGPQSWYSKANWNPTLVVNTNGDCYGFGDPYPDERWAYGNLFQQPLDTILSGDRYRRSVDVADRNIAYNCTRCPYFGACDGYAVAEDRYNCPVEHTSGLHRCVVERAALTHATRRLRELGPAVSLPA